MSDATGTRDGSREDIREQATQAEVDRRAHTDPISDSAGCHPIGTAAGAASGAISGAIVGSEIGGPLGLGIGGAIGAIVGGVTGHGIAEEMNPSDEVMPPLRAPRNGTPA